MAGLGLGLIGAGVAATFTDAGTATQNVSVGTFGITVTSTSPNCVSGGSAGAWTVVCNEPTILSSAASSDPFSFVVTSTGTVPALIHVTKGAAPAAPFSDLMASNPADVTLNQSQTQSYSGGLAWGTLTNANEGQTASLVYTITATG